MIIVSTGFSGLLTFLIKERYGGSLSTDQEEKAREIKRRYAAQYLRRPEVSGMGTGKDDTGQYVIDIYVNTQDPHIPEQFPSDLEGVPVKIIYSGPFRSISSNQIAR